MPRVLIVDDDPVTLHFLATAVGGFGCSVVATANGAEALTALGWATFDLLLIDRRLPDRGGAELLADLRARHVAAPAIATTAELTTEIDAQLRAAGFVACVEKPVGVARLRQALEPFLAADGEPGGPAVLNDAGALAALGSDAEALRALRRLFVEELDKIEHEWAGGERAIERERLHRLRASCGFCGAAALGEAARRLEQALREDGASVPTLLQEFLAACRLTRSALAAPIAPGH